MNNQRIFPKFEPNNHIISAGNDSCIFCWCIPNSIYESVSKNSKKKKGKSNKNESESKENKNKELTSKNETIAKNSNEVNSCNSKSIHPALKIQHSSKINWIKSSKFGQ